ncbi:MAG: 23S rRNA (adenine(1618)-N(6))-methyltransferase RlmF [Bacteroidetes bacterium]|nr:MAG: 23S rRNA (adenine(1618)-N(6))-methyltransferase RlmF [Bacteroidota bacterium]
MPQEQKPTPSPTAVKSKLHRRNKHKHRYNFKKLIEQTPELGNHVALNKYGIETINFFDATAVKLLNQSLLKFDYDIEHWDIPEGYLCPPIPGRADYIHYIADLLANDDNRRIPRGQNTHCLDIGTGANCIYPIIGVCEYNWKFVASDIDPISIKTAQAISHANQLDVDIRHQEDAKNLFRGIIQKDEYFDLTVCNPPFHASEAEAISSNLRKLKNLRGKKPEKPNTSFGGQHNELWCKGGELRFIKDMVKESVEFKEQVLWFSTLVSKHGNLQDIYLALKKVEAYDVETIPMGQGNKSSRIVAWSFHSRGRRKQWRRESQETDK